MKKIIGILLLPLAVLTSCLKEKETLQVNDNTSRLVVEFTNGDAATLNTLAVPVGTGMQQIDLTELRVIPRADLKDDVSVNITVNPTLVDDYNAENGTALEVPPASVFSLPTSSFTLTPSSRAVTVPIMLDPSTLPSNTYAIGLTISSVSAGDVGLKKDFLVELKAKNIYDGEYISNGYLYHPALPRTIDDLPKTLTTFTANSVLCDLGDLGGSGYFAIFEVDASNNVTITEGPGAAGGPYEMFTTGLPSANPGYTPQWPGSSECNNVWDPVNQEFRVRYGYMGATGWRVTEEIIRKN